MADLTGKITEIGKKILVSVGKNNKPTYAVMAIATANGIFKPISSLTDKKEKPEARKYAALREFATECVAVPTYWACGVGAATLGAKLFKDNPEKKAIARANMMFLGVCTAAVFVIPAVCSVALWTLDKALGKNKPHKKEPAKLDIISQAPEVQVYSDTGTKFGNNIYRPSMSTFLNNGGLKI
ncbi:hypothetical protein J6O86_01785 [bacterium]|nr:hypothetical protein [bacterium]